MPTSDFESGRTIPLQIPEPVWREWKINGVDADHLAELQAEHGEAMGYEFDWGQIIEEVFDDNPTADSDNLEDLPYLAVRWHFVLCDVYTAFLDGGGNLGELSDLAIMILAEVEHSRHELPEAWREDALPAVHLVRRRKQHQCLRGLRRRPVQRCGCAQMDEQLLYPRGAADRHRPASPRKRGGGPSRHDFFCAPSTSSGRSD